MENILFSGGFIGSKLIMLDSVPSTNDFLKDELSKSKPFPEGTVIMAVDQYAGRGQRGSGWQSEAGKNLTFSLLLRPSVIPADRAFLLTAGISLGLVDFLDSLLPPGHDVRIKWPNDIYVDGRKIAGILIENSYVGSLWKHAVVGIGLNVLQHNFPSDMIDRVTSLAVLEPDRYVSDSSDAARLFALLKQLCSQIEHRYLQINPATADEVMKTYHEKLYRLGEEHMYLIDGVAVQGTIVGVARSGRLQIDFNGHIADFDLKEIQFT